MQSINYIINSLKEENYFIKHYNIFMINEPKYRIVMSLRVKDKIVNHFVTRACLEVKLSKYLDIRNIAARKNMGIDYGIKKLKKYLELNKKYSKFYILKLDISKYFYSIDHDVLKNLIKDKLDDFEYRIISKIIDSTNEEYINQKIEYLKVLYESINPKRKDEIDNIPFYECGKGLPIGNMTSQFLAIFYLSKLDHYIVNDLRLKYYLRYMDDFIIIHHNKAYLENAKDKIINILGKEYKLEINKKKTFIVDNKVGFTFLGYKFKVINNKTIINVSSSTRKGIIKRIKTNRFKFANGKKSYEELFSSITNYKHVFKYASNIKIRNAIDKYWF